MDESEKRKERLRAMRIEAQEVEASHSAATTTCAAPGYLSNPLAMDIPGNEDPSSAPCRFDFYTDPMAAFSSDTKRVKVGNQITPNNSRPRISSHVSGGPRNLETTTPAAQQFQSNYSQEQRMYQVQGSYQNFDPQRNPKGMARPFPMHLGNPPGVWNGAEGAPNYSFPGSGLGSPGSPGFRGQGSPGFRPPGRPAHRPPGSPGFGPSGSSGFGPPGVPGFRPPATQEFRPLGSPGTSIAGQGRGYWRSHSPRPHSVIGRPSPSSSSGRSGGRWSTSPGSGWRGGRGRGSHGHPAEDKQLGPERFYHESMVEDPWKFLQPVIWKGVDAPVNHMNIHNSSKPTTGTSTSTRNESTSEGSNMSTSKPSLAEYLAASLNERTSESPST